VNGDSAVALCPTGELLFNSSRSENGGDKLVSHGLHVFSQDELRDSDLPHSYDAILKPLDRIIGGAVRSSYKEWIQEQVDVHPAKFRGEEWWWKESECTR
jgi:hypothetical protein